MHKDLLLEIEKAMKLNPDLSILETVEYVLDTYLPYRKKCIAVYDKDYQIVFTRRTNSEILKALRIHNESRNRPI